jgi:ribosomal protein S12 methylthiotransferase
VEALRWIRVHYLYPNTITERLIETMAAGARVLDYVDLPLQHAHPATLRRMRRGGSAEAFLDLLGRFRRAMPEATLRSTFIVGFPGETEAEFEALLQFVRRAQLDHLGAFTYSHEEGTSAHALPDDVPAAVKRARHARLMRAQKRIVAQAHAARIGTRTRVLVDGPSTEHELVLRGRLEGQAPDIDPLVYLTDCDPATVPTGSFLDVELVGSRGYDLLARPENVIT